MELVPESEKLTRLSHPEKGGEEVQAFIQNATRMTYRELQKVRSRLNEMTNNSFQVEFLQDSPPTRSLIPFAMNAQVSVFPAEHAVGGQIGDLLVEASHSK